MVLANPTHSQQDLKAMPQLQIPSYCSVWS